MKRIIYIAIGCIVLLTGCNQVHNMESAFDSKMKNDTFDYHIIKKIEKEEDGVIFYTTYENIENEENMEEMYPTISLAYLVNQDNGWELINTSDCSLEWSIVSFNDTAVFCGSIIEPRVSKIIVGEREATIVEAEGRKFWYSFEATMDKTIKVILTDGQEEWIKEM